MCSSHFEGYFSKDDFPFLCYNFPLKKTFNLINAGHELYGACRHNTQFHRFESLQSPSADEGQTCPENSMVSKNNSTAPTKINPWKAHICMPVSVGM